MGDGLALDIRAAVRALLASRAISLAAALTLALAIGTLTALFSIANGLVLRPLPVRDPQQLVTVTSDTALRFGFQAGAGWSYPMWERLRERAAAFDGAFAWMLQPLDLAEADAPQPVQGLFASGGIFSTLGVAAVVGRTFTDADDSRDGPGAPRVAVVNETLRSRLPGHGNVVGATIDAGPCGSGGCIVIGVVGDALYGRSLRDQAPPTLYVPFAQSAALGPPDAPFRISVRAGADPTRVSAMLTDRVRAVDPGLTVTFRSLDRDVAASLAQERLVATLAGLFGAIALLLSAIGLYGVSSFAVSRRRPEIGIRLALGGQRVEIVRGLTARIAVFVLAGGVMGVLAALWVSRSIAPLVYGLEPRDPATLAASAITLASVAGIAALVPAWRGTRVEPAEVLRRH